MREKNRNRNDGSDRPESRDDDTSERLNEARDTGRELLDAAERALSGDSRQFLHASRQHGGE